MQYPRKSGLQGVSPCADDSMVKAEDSSSGGKGQSVQYSCAWNTGSLSANPCGLGVEMTAFPHRRGWLLKRFWVRVLPPALDLSDGARNGPEGPSGALLPRPAKRQGVWSVAVRAEMTREQERWCVPVGNAVISTVTRMRDRKEIPCQRQRVFKAPQVF